MNTLTAIDDNNSRISVDLKLSLNDSKKAIELLFKSLGNPVTVSEQEMLDFVVLKTKEFWVSGIATQEKKDLLVAAENASVRARQELLDSTETIVSKIRL